MNMESEQYQSSFYIDTNGNLVETRFGHVGNEEILRIFDGIM